MLDIHFLLPLTPDPHNYSTTIIIFFPKIKSHSAGEQFKTLISLMMMEGLSRSRPVFFPPILCKCLLKSIRIVF